MDVLTTLLAAEMAPLVNQLIMPKEDLWDDADRENPSARRKTCSKLYLKTRTALWCDLRSKPGPRDEGADD